MMIPALREKIQSASPQDAKAYEGVVKELVNTEGRLKLALESYNAWEHKILREAQDEALRNRLLRPTKRRWQVPAVMALIGISGLVFTLALAKPPSTAAPAAPKLGALSAALDADSSRNLWSSLDLSNCEAYNEVPVLVLETTAQGARVQTIAVSDKYVVKTFP